MEPVTLSPLKLLARGCRGLVMLLVMCAVGQTQQLKVVWSWWLLLRLGLVVVAMT
jgi:hypothetical protein